VARGIKLIDQRPVTVADRGQAGHWEGDLLIGALHHSAVITLVERTSRLTLLADLPASRAGHPFISALKVAFDRVPPVLRKTLTWDQGFEMMSWRLVERDLGLEVFFCHPRSPWERASNENTNRQLRYWLPKSTDLSVHGQARLETIAAVLNTQPRRLHGWRSAQDIYDHHAIAATV